MRPNVFTSTIGIALHKDSRGTITLEIRDCDSNSRFLKAELTNEQVVDIMRGYGDVKAEASFYGLDKLGKKMEVKILKFPLEVKVGAYGEERERVACETVDKHIPDGWEADKYFRSQDSFFVRDGQMYARTTIRRWVDKTKTNNNKEN